MLDLTLRLPALQCETLSSGHDYEFNSIGASAPGGLL